MKIESLFRGASLYAAFIGRRVGLLWKDIEVAIGKKNEQGLDGKIL